MCPLAAADPSFSTDAPNADDDSPWLAALQPPSDSRRLLAPRSAWAILALAAADARFAACVADGLGAPEASRARARLKTDGLIAMLPLLGARAGRAWCTTSDPAALTRLWDDARVLITGQATETGRCQAYVRARDLDTLVDDFGLHAAPGRRDQAILLRPVVDPWPFAERPAVAPDLVQALDVLELAAEGRPVDPSAARAAWDLLEQHAARDVPSWYRATRPPRAGPNSKVAVLAPRRALRPVTAAATDAGLLAAMLFAIGQPVRRHDLLAASGWTQARLQAAVDALLAEPPRGQQVMVDDDRLELVAAPTASSLVQRLFRHFERGNKVLEPLDLPETPPTLWPAVMGAGTFLFMLGLNTTSVYSILGGLLVALAIYGWTGDLLHA